MPTVETVKAKINDAKERLDGLCRLPVKSEIDWQMIEELRDYIAGLNENLGELKREEAGRARGW